MFKASVFGLLAMVFVLSNGAPTIDESSSRVIGGSDADPKAAIYQGILRISGSFHCSGSIISKRTVVTAARCVDGVDAASATFTVGTNTVNSGGVTYSVDKIIMHEDYSTVQLFNDVAVLIFKDDILFSDTVGPIAIQTEEVGGGIPTTFTGWGSTQLGGGTATNLQTIQLKTITVAECQDVWTGNLVHDSQICTLTRSGEGACHGDFGGPLVVNNKLAGIFSWGNPCALGMPDVYTRVTIFADWIQQHSVE